MLKTGNDVLVSLTKPLPNRLSSQSVEKLKAVFKSGNDASVSLTRPLPIRLSSQSFEQLFTALRREDYVVISSYDFTRFFHVHDCDGTFGNNHLCEDFAKKYVVTWFDVSDEPYLLRANNLRQDIIDYRKDGYRFYECICTLQNLARDFIPKRTADLSFYEPVGHDDDEIFC